MSFFKRRTAPLFGFVLALGCAMGMLNMPIASAEESNLAEQETQVTQAKQEMQVMQDTQDTQNDQESEESQDDSALEEQSIFSSIDYQGKSNLKEYWDAVKSYRSEILDMTDAFESFELTEEQQALVDDLIETAQKDTILIDLESTKTELTEMVASLEARKAESQNVAGEASSAYNYPQGDVLTRSGGVNYFNGRKETWYSQRVLPGGGLNIPGRHVAADGTVRDGDNYIVVAASDLAYGTITETSLGTAKVYDSGCAAGTTDVYVDW